MNGDTAFQAQKKREKEIIIILIIIRFLFVDAKNNRWVKEWKQNIMSINRNYSTAIEANVAKHCVQKRSEKKKKLEKKKN